MAISFRVRVPSICGGPSRQRLSQKSTYARGIIIQRICQLRLRAKNNFLPRRTEGGMVWLTMLQQPGLVVAAETETERKKTGVGGIQHIVEVSLLLWDLPLQALQLIARGLCA